jgi:hypothetical protein
MKKGFSVLFVLVMVLSFVLVSPVKQAAAISIIDGVADGDWSTGTGVSVDLSAAPAPAWLQLMDKGVTLPAAVTVCHPFRGGQFGWVAEIRQLVDGKWVKLATTLTWVPTTEGKLFVCADAPAAGTYALFAYYPLPVEVTILQSPVVTP